MDRDAALPAPTAPGPAAGEAAAPLVDAYGRRLHYLRLSITDRCNYRCVYCLPEGCEAPAEEAPLSRLEIARLVRGFAALGFWKVRLTGGEPTVRSDVVEIVRDVARTPGIRKVALTTNGYRLDELAPELLAAGLSGLNVSLDSLEPERFRELTGNGRWERVMAGIERALAVGLPSVKLNVVLLRGLEERELGRFLQWTREAPLTIRFIELMETGENRAAFADRKLPPGVVEERLLREGWTRLPHTGLDGPATDFSRPGHRGKIGLIAAYGHGFCETCNRLRVTARGALRLCLFGEEEVPLRHLLDSDDPAPLAARVRAAVAVKPAEHLLRLGRCGTTPHLAATGG